MSRYLVLILAAALLLGAGCTHGKKQTMKDNPHIGHVRHVVQFKFKDGTSQEKIRQIEQAFGALPAHIPQIIDYEWGTNNSPEPHAQGYTHCFLVTFANEADRDAYLPHPAHQDFVKIAGPHFDKVHVVDYTVRH